MKLNFVLFKENHRRQKANTAIFYNVVGTLLPFIIVSVILLLFYQFDKIISVLDRGDFCIYSVGLFSTALFLFNYNKNSIPSKFDYWLYQSILYLITIAAVLYAGVYTKELVLKDLSFNFDILRFGSIGLFLISILSAYRGLLLEYRKDSPNVDVEAERRQEVNEIMKDL